MALLLLTYPALMQSDNLLLPEESPFGLPPGQFTDVLDDLDSGTMYKEGHEYYCQGPDAQEVDTTGQTWQSLLNMHVISSDKTHVDTKGKITLEPVNMTFGIFKRPIRNPQSA